MAIPKNEIVEALFGALKTRNVSVPEFSLQTGIPRDRVYKWRQQGTAPKAEDEKTVMRWINAGSVDINPNLIAPEKDISLQAIHNLTETGKIHAENQKVMVSNESRLITLLESTVGSTKDNSIASPAIMSGILVAMAKIGSGKKWHSEEEALRELGRMLSPQAAENKKKKNTQIDERK